MNTVDQSKAEAPSHKGTVERTYFKNSSRDTWQPRCVCGWYSAASKSREAAVEAADEHARYANKS